MTENQKKANELIRTFEISPDLKEGLVRELKNVGMAILAQAMMISSGTRYAYDSNHTQRLRLKKFLKNVGFDKHQMQFGDIKIEITIKGQSLPTSDMDIEMAVFRRLIYIHEEEERPASTRHPTPRTILLSCYRSFASYLYRNNLKKNKIAKIVESLIVDLPITQDITLQQITAVIFKKPH